MDEDLLESFKMYSFIFCVLFFTVSFLNESKLK